MSGRNHMLFRPTDTLKDISVVLREDQVDWLNGLTDCDEEHDSRSETLRRVIDVARDYIESSLELTTCRCPMTPSCRSTSRCGRSRHGVHSRNLRGEGRHRESLHRLIHLCDADVPISRRRSVVAVPLDGVGNGVSDPCP